jgi:hypothetical protein
MGSEWLFSYLKVTILYYNVNYFIYAYLLYFNQYDRSFVINWFVVCVIKIDTRQKLLVTGFGLDLCRNSMSKWTWLVSRFEILLVIGMVNTDLHPKECVESGCGDYFIQYHILKPEE